MKFVVTNIIATLLLAILTAELGYYLFCDTYINRSCYSLRNILFIAVIASFGVLLVFFFTQFIKTHEQLKPKKKQLPISIHNMSVTYERAVRVLWHAPEKEEEVVLPEMNDLGWHIKFEDDYVLEVTQRQFYYWLLKVEKAQREIKLEGKGKDRMRSPIGQRVHIGIGRRRLRAYVQMSRDAGLLDQVNASVSILKDQYLSDPWLAVKKMGEVMPCKEL